MLTLTIEGQEVQCREVDGKRVWSCWCDFYQKRHSQDANREAYCPHTGTAILRCIEDGTIDPTDAAAGELEKFAHLTDGFF